MIHWTLGMSPSSVIWWTRKGRSFHLWMRGLYVVTYISHVGNLDANRSIKDGDDMPSLLLDE